MHNSTNLSVVIQGGIDSIITPKCIASIRRFLPQAEIILSTWISANVDNLDYDILVQSEDPGAYSFGNNSGKLNNLNRILRSTQAALAKATRPYILKLRSDLVLMNDNILKLSDNYKRIDSFKLFEQRIFTSLLFTFKFEQLKDNPHRHYRPFQVSDWWQFGLNQDIKKLYDVPLVDEPEFSQYFINHQFHPSSYVCYPELLWKMSPEQYVLSTCAKQQYPEISFNDISDYNPKNINQSEIIIVNNFIILNAQISGIHNFKKEYLSRNTKIPSDDAYSNGLYKPSIWILDYKKYCDPQYRIPLKFFGELIIGNEKEIKKLKKHYDRFSTPFKTILGWFNSGLAIILYSIKIGLKILSAFFQKSA